MKNIRFALLLIVGVALLASAQRRPSAAMTKLMNAEYFISNMYVDTVNDNQLVEGAIRGMLESLDPHSSYTDAKETKELEEPLQGEFEGIGITFNMKQDTLYVIQTVPGGPSDRVGILAGDRIVTVNDSLIAGQKMKNSDIMRRLRGKKGTKVNVQVKRGSSKQLIDFTITRDKIPMHSVDAAYMLDERTGYVRISRFGAKTHNEMVEAMDKLVNEGMQQVIIDLSDNGGGFLNAAVDMCNEFMERGQMIVYTQGEHAPRSEASARGNGKYSSMPVVVIVNQYSASASEIFSGAMQDWDRGVIVGRRTFGKGLVQRPFRFDDGSMIRLTVARYYTPSGRCIQKPYTKGDKKAYEDDINDRVKDGELYNIDSVRVDQSQRYLTLKNKRPIYGGGGILPDVFVPVDTAEYSVYYRDLMAKGVFNQFAVEYVDQHRAELKTRFATVEDFDRFFNLGEAEMQRFIAIGEAEKVKHNPEQYATSQNLMRMVIKGLIARDIYSDPSAYTKVINHRNRDLDAALNVINDPTEYQRCLHVGNTEYGRNNK